MSNIKTHTTQTFKEDKFNNKINYLDLKKLDTKIFVDLIPNKQEAIEILKKLKNIKMLIKDKILSFINKSINKHSNKHQENLDNEYNVCRKIENPNKISFVELYKKHLKLKDYKDISPINFLSSKINIKIRSAIAKFQISKEILIIKIENTKEKSSNSLFLLLDHEIKDKDNGKNNIDNYKDKDISEGENKTGIILSYHTQNDEQDLFNISQAKNLLNSISLEIIDNREISLIMKDLTIAMVKILENKFGKTNKNRIGFGITNRILNEIYDIKTLDNKINNKECENTSNSKECESVLNEKGGYEDDLEYGYDDEDQY
jgi:hypothetical protein